jgi:hypothetical protein
MRIRGELNEDELNDVRSLTHSRAILPSLLRPGNAMGLFLVCFIGWFLADRLLHRDFKHWMSIGGIWAAVILVAVLALRQEIKYTKRAPLQIDLATADWITVLPDGLKVDDPDGETTFNLWIGFRSWREGSRVILLERVIGPGVVTIPLSGMSDVEKENLRGMLSARINPR